MVFEGHMVEGRREVTMKVRRGERGGGAKSRGGTRVDDEARGVVVTEGEAADDEGGLARILAFDPCRAL